MKLYLSSYQVGNEPQKLAALAGSNKRAAVIVNALDGFDVAGRAERLDRELAAMSRLGFMPEEVDLRDYFSKPGALENALANYGLLWIRGGNVFILRKAMAKSGFDAVIRNLLDTGIVYAGYSAASCVAGPTLHGLELCDDEQLTAKDYPTETIWEGLGLIDYAIAPHYKSDHPESPLIDQVAAYFQAHHIPYKTLHDGEAIIIND